MIETCPLGSVVDVSAGQPAPKSSEFGDEGLPFIRAGSLEKLLNGGSLSDCEKIPQSAATRKRFRIYPKDTVVFAKSGMSATLGRVYRLPEPAHVVSHLAALVPTGRYDPVFLTHWLRKNPPSHLIKDPAYPSIRVGDIVEVEVPAVPLEDQQRIAVILDKADGVQRKRAKSLELARRLLRAAFEELFGNLHTNSNRWDTVLLGDILSVNPQNGLYRPAKDYGSGTDILRIDGFYDGYIARDRPLKKLRIDFRTVEKYLLSNGDIVINRVNSREYLGKSALIDGLTENAVFESNMMRLRVDESIAEPRFIVDQLQTQFVKMQILRASKDAVNQSSINQTDVKNIEVRLPPVELQRRYAGIVRKKIAADAALHSALAEAQSLSSSLAQRAFRGEL